ncbi:hypothetical protein [Nonomuraea endophytica]|uniref:Major facilitator superfamily (MFS) profile domain-containing protein n=1 Tax=Nonomuraea endophytica TaxID=714136 RepID=A0A7W8EF04_9ACTN|nr:hypothetical protein [Nonomuraea endophytica]MBB5076928.1 hypothetical protein [Nonomuraea endophytica]
MSVAAVVGLLVFVEITSGLIQGMTPAITPAIGKQLGVSNASLHWISAPGSWTCTPAGREDHKKAGEGREVLKLRRFW